MRKVKTPTTRQNTAARKSRKITRANKLRKGNLYTSTPKQATVVGLYLCGRKKARIARELGLDRGTVRRILSQQENESMLQQYRAAVMNIVPDALITAHHLVKMGDRQMATDILYGSRTLIQRHEVLQVEEPKRTYAYTRVEFFGKYGRWPRNEELAEFDKTLTLDIEPLVKEGAE